VGVWGAGLYSGDFAMDLRSTTSAVGRLPFDGDKLLDILCQAEATAAGNPNDEDHTVFWLVIADQFAKRGIACDRARDKALAIIDGGSDIALHARLGMSGPGLEKRRKMLQGLRSHLTAPQASRKPGPVLKKPQAFLMDVGDVFVYPTCAGRCINAYAQSKEKDPHWAGQDGWSALVIIDHGRAFDFLAWYRPLTIMTATAERPTLAGLRGEMPWILRSAGTCSPVHFRRMELEKIGTLPVDVGKSGRAFPGTRPGTRQAISDISLCNHLHVGPALPAVSLGRPYSTIPDIGQILSD
jgi:hypothetical protein